MKKFIKYALVALFVFTILPISANAKTLGELKKEYSDLESKYKSKNNEIKQNEAASSAAKSRIESIYGEIETAEKDVQDLNSEISKLNESILEKDNQVKELMRFFETSEGESTYLEYIFKAKSITDFIYRLSVTEQLTTYNNKLIDEMHSMITKNNDNIKKLHEKEDSLKSLQEELTQKVQDLAVQKETLVHDEQDIEDEIKDKKETLEYYKKLGCNDTQDLSTCMNGQLPLGTKFWRPLNMGHVTDEYGYRICPFHGRELHTGIDVSGYDLNVRAISDGKVIRTNYSNSGYGNHIIIVHNINGRSYSSLYGHLRSINVSVGQIVNKDTIIGIMGSTGSSTATHLHLNIYNGTYPNATLANPRDYINFPSQHYYKWTDRTSYYK